MMINETRLHSRLEQLASLHRGADGGLYCLGLSVEENEAHACARTFMEQAGLSVRVDAAGNLIGRWEGTDAGAAVVLTGSHLDTVYGGGAFDGRLGVVAAIEAVQCMREHGIRTRHPIEVCVYRDEEGTRFLGSYSGARHRAGTEIPSASYDRRDRDNISMREALLLCGIDPERTREAALPAGYAKAHLELHIEQGLTLESKGIPVGIVTGLYSQLRGEYSFRGCADHAGATPMDLRRDSLCAAAEWVLAVESEAAAVEDCVATVGRILAEPGGVNIIPGVTRCSIDLRSLEIEKRDAVFERIDLAAQAICARRGIAVESRITARGNTPKPCDSEIQSLLHSICRNLSLSAISLPSGAGHDTGAFIPVCPSGMIFVRSQGGISHNPEEYSTPEDCAAGAQILLEALLQLAERIEPAGHDQDGHPVGCHFPGDGGIS